MREPRHVLAVFLGGAAGASLRWAIAEAIDVDGWPVGILVANVAGSLLLGWIVGQEGLTGAFTHHGTATGFCGGLTTMSAFAVGVADMLRDGRVPAAGSYLVVTVVVGLWAASVGIVLGRRRLAGRPGGATG